MTGMHRLGAVGAALGLVGSLAGCRIGGSQPPRPKLVVLITVDQLRADLLDRYDKLFTGGFRRLRDQGMRFTNTTVDHAITVSHPGHVTLATGVFPSHHGIVDAAFFEGPPGHRQLVDSLLDPAESIVGEPEQKGVSPRKILSPTISEWILAADPQSRCVALGSGQYSSLLHAGHARPEVYWYSIQAGRYVTSSFYRKDYPDWVEKFNREQLPKLQEASSPWELRVSEEGRALALPDGMLYEGDKVHITFPHRVEDADPEGKLANAEIRRKALAWWISTTPTLDAATLALAQESVTALSLGQRPSMDYLSIVVSQVDDIGHYYGPFSLEQLDNLLRLDQELGEFFKFLDAKVGQQEILVALSADHGVPNVPEQDRERGIRARRLTVEEMEAALNAARKAASASAGTPEEISIRVSEVLNRFDFVADAMTPGPLLDPGPTCDPFTTLYRHSYRADRVPRFPLFSLTHEGEGAGEYGLAVRLTSGTMIDLDPAVHGSPYMVDRQVPMVFMGPGVPHGLSDQRAHTVDLAPTLARLAGIPAPDGLDGHPLILTSPR